MAIEHDLESPLARAVRAAGSQSAFGRLIGRSQAYVHKLLANGRELTAREAILAEKGTGIPKEQLLPDIFEPAEGATDREQLAVTAAAPFPADLDPAR